MEIFFDEYLSPVLRVSGIRLARNSQRTILRTVLGTHLVDIVGFALIDFPATTLAA